MGQIGSWRRQNCGGHFLPPAGWVWKITENHRWNGQRFLIQAYWMERGPCPWGHSWTNGQRCSAKDFPPCYRSWGHSRRQSGTNGLYLKEKNRNQTWLIIWRTCYKCCLILKQDNCLQGHAPIWCIEMLLPRLVKPRLRNLVFHLP